MTLLQLFPTLVFLLGLLSGAYGSPWLANGILEEDLQELQFVSNRNAPVKKGGQIFQTWRSRPFERQQCTTRLQVVFLLCEGSRPRSRAMQSRLASLKYSIVFTQNCELLPVYGSLTQSRKGEKNHARLWKSQFASLKYFYEVQFVCQSKRKAFVAIRKTTGKNVTYPFRCPNSREAHASLFQIWWSP